MPNKHYQSLNYLAYIFDLLIMIEIDKNFIFTDDKDKFKKCRN